jgi:DNA processing protein
VLADVTVRSVAMVGARAATAYGEHVAGDLSCGLGERGFAVISGLAYGIDGAAHRGALACGAVSIGVVAGGLDRAYPAGHDRLMARLADEGAVVSEVPPGSAPTRGRFLQRNRLIAALATGTVVVEAALRSGSLNTARTAALLGRPVGAVPGPVTSASSAGCHALLRDGVATLVTDADEIADLVGRIGTDAATPPQSRRGPRDDLDPEVARVLDALPVRSGGRSTGSAPPQVSTQAPSSRHSGSWHCWAWLSGTALGGGWCEPARSAEPHQAQARRAVRAME